MTNKNMPKTNGIDNIDNKIERTGRFEWYGDGTIHFLPDDGETIDWWTPWTGRPTPKINMEIGSLQVISGNLMFEKIGPKRFILNCIDEPMISLSLHTFAKEKPLNALDGALQTDNDKLLRLLGRALHLL